MLCLSEAIIYCLKLKKIGLLSALKKEKEEEIGIDLWFVIAFCRHIYIANI